MDRGILHRRLNARCCLLDSMQNLRLSDFWTENDPGDLRLFQRKVGLPNAIGQSAIIYKDGWRLDKGRGLPMIVPILKVFARRNIDKWNIRQVLIFLIHLYHSLAHHKCGHSPCWFGKSTPIASLAIGFSEFLLHMIKCFCLVMPICMNFCQLPPPETIPTSCRAI